MNGYAPPQRPGLLAEALEAKAQLARISLLGHDLRAALSDILGGLQMVSDADLSQPVRAQIDRALAASKTLARLLDADLSLAAPQPPAALHLSQLLHDIERRWSGHAQERGLRFHLALAPDVPLLLRLDRLAVERVLSNMISNAFKHAIRSPVRLIVACEGEGQLGFTVLDDGPGFDPAQGVRLCAPGSRGGGSAGDGLGLFIAREMALHLGGWLALSNRAEGGACVCLTVPLCPADLLQPFTAPLPDLSDCRVLIVDDSAVTRTLLRQMLEAMGASCACAADGAAALEQLDLHRYDLMVLDIELPRSSGLEVLRQIRRAPGPRAQLPVVACTAHALRTAREAILAAGANAVLCKPLDGAHSLGAAIFAALDQDPAGDAAQKTERTFAALIDTLAPETRTEVAAQLLADLRAIERALAAALAQCALPQVRTESHALVSIAGSVGAELLHQLAQRLFDAAESGDRAAAHPLGADVLAQTRHLIALAAQHCPEGCPS